MKQRPELKHLRGADPRPASSFASSPMAFEASPRQQQQDAHLAQLKGTGASASMVGIAQLKGRVALDKIESPEKRRELEEEIAKARETRITAKHQARVAWLGHPDGAKDDEYNDAMEKARGDYGKTLWAIKIRKGLTAEQFPTGRDYYGTESGGVFKRPDNGKEYVEDANGVFMPRYVRRELNKFDLPKIKAGDGLTPTGARTHGGKYGDSKNKAGKLNQPLDVADREFLQQSWGGGANQFAFSHTATHYPILSNDHHNFGAVGTKDLATDAHGRIVTDLSKIAKTERHTQWKLEEEDRGGHKIRRGAESFTEPWMKKRRDKVIRSGYRNMEVVTSGVPNAAVAKRQKGWEAQDASGKGHSAAGEWFKAFRKEREGHS